MPLRIQIANFELHERKLKITKRNRGFFGRVLSQTTAKKPPNVPPCRRHVLPMIIRRTENDALYEAKKYKLGVVVACVPCRIYCLIKRGSVISLTSLHRFRRKICRWRGLASADQLRSTGHAH